MRGPFLNLFCNTNRDPAMIAQSTLFISRVSAAMAAERYLRENSGVRKIEVCPATRRDVDTREVESGFTVRLIGKTGRRFL
ncbi:hypothetical protein CPT_Pasto_001 [Rhizobium phage Pasto]|uniref:Uncharacterized protein n=1 Tax=Rhizobium phage Pasto TaxID=2767575 RepID=A0A7S6U2Z8_9CAUD|nr:hypothetical protein CPT_Pasto_001 [Rhizobium phage Pasto]